MLLYEYLVSKDYTLTKQEFVLAVLLRDKRNRHIYLMKGGAKMIDEVIADGCVAFLKSKDLYAYTTKNNEVFLDVCNADESFSCSIKLCDDDVMEFNSLHIQELQEANLVEC